MIEQIVSLLTGILKELTGLRTSYDAALAEAKAMRHAAIAEVRGDIEKNVAAAKNQIEKAKEQAPAPEPFPPTPATSASTAAPVATAVVPISDATGAVQVTREQCGQALVELATAKNRELAVATLAKFNAKLVKEVQEKDLLPFYAAIQEALK